MVRVNEKRWLREKKKVCKKIEKNVVKMIWVVDFLSRLIVLTLFYYLFVIE